jgi:hypothetical protein
LVRVLGVCLVFRAGLFPEGQRHWTSSMGESLLAGFHALGVRTAGSGLTALPGALFKEYLDLSDAKIDLGEEQLLHVNGQSHEDFVPDIFREACEGQPVRRTARAGHSGGEMRRLVATILTSVELAARQ